MALANLGDLKASVAAWLKRSDLATQIPDFVFLAEARIARDLRLTRQLVSSDLTTTAGVATLALPSDWLESLAAELVGFGPIETCGIEALEAVWGEDGGMPRQCAIRGSTLVLYPVPDGAYTLRLVYWQKLALSDDASTNWLLTNHPGVYLYATLAEAEPYLVNDPRAATWEAKYQQEREGLRAADQNARFSGSVLRTVTR